MVLQFLALDVLELQVGDKDTSTLEVKIVRNSFTTQHGAVAVPVDSTLLARIQGRLENVQAQVILEHTVTVIKYQHVTGIRILVQGTVETNWSHGAFDDFVFDSAPSQLVKKT